MSDGKRKGKNWTAAVFFRQICGDKKRVNGVRSLKGYKLSSIIPSRSALKNVFLGFSVDGNFVFSYVFKYTCSVQPRELLYSFKYKLNVWSFSPGKKLKKVGSVPLFGDTPINEELYLIFAQYPTSPSTLIILGHDCSIALSQEIKKCYTSTSTLVNIISLNHLTSSHICFDSSNNHSISFYYSMPATVSMSMMLICLLPSKVVVINCGTNLLAFRLNHFVEHNGRTIDQNNAIFISSGNNCSSCGKSDLSSDKCVSTILEIEQCLQDLCQQFCESNGLSFLGIRDYESYVIEDYVDDSNVLLLLGVLIEVDEDNKHYYEGVFTLQWNLNTGLPHCISFKTPIEKYLQSKINLGEWDRIAKCKQQISSQRIQTSRLRTAHTFTNLCVLRNKSAKSLFDVEGVCAIIL